MRRPLCIMIVDDEPIVGKRLKRLLEKDGHKIHIFTRGSLALESFGLCQYDMIITDLKMGNVDGINVLEYASGLTPPPKVIMISGLKEKRFSEEAVYKGAFAFLVKPFRIEELRAIIKKASEEQPL